VILNLFVFGSITVKLPGIISKETMILVPRKYQQKQKKKIEFIYQALLRPRPNIYGPRNKFESSEEELNFDLLNKGGEGLDADGELRSTAV
jgi:hypothetical protein